MKKRKVTLYVKGVKTAVGREKSGEWGFAVGAGARGGYRIIRDYKTYSEAAFETVLPKDQKRVVEIVRKATHKHGFELEIVDVTNMNILRKIFQEEVKGIKIFPALRTDTGEKIEGNFSEEQVESLLVKSRDNTPH